MYNRAKVFVLLLAVLVAVGVLALTAPFAAQAVPREPLKNALLSTVRVAVPIEGRRDSYSTGSGTFLSREGYVLTNFHVMGDVDRGKLYNRKGQAFIAVNPTSLKGAPAWTYVAELVKGDPNLDLALLKVVGYMDSDQPVPASLPVAVIELGNSDDAAIGDELSVIGFPGLGGDTVTFTQGKVAGFLDEDNNGVFEWIKTDAEVNHGNSGGLAIDEMGRMVGVPTAGYSDVEAAGKISLVRPINLALPLLRSALAGGGTPAPSASCPVQTHPGGAVISDLLFAQSVDREGNPGGVSAAFAPGIDTVYATFKYDRFRNGREFRFTWYLDNEAVFEDSVAWNGGSRGNDWVNVTNDPELPEGVYRLELRYDNTLLACGGFVVGDAPSGVSPQFGAITFAQGQRNDQPVGPDVRFPSGTKEIYAFFDYKGMTDGMSWRQAWYVDDEVGLDAEDTWEAGGQGNYWVSINSKKGLPDGAYLLELYVGDKLLQSGEFVIGSGAAQRPGNEGVVVIGTVVDANRRTKAIPGATVIFLNPGVRIDQWVKTQKKQDVYATAVTDADGWFQLSNPVQPGETYPVIVVADGYRPVTEQNFTVPADAESPHELTITLVRQ